MGRLLAAISAATLLLVAVSTMLYGRGLDAEAAIAAGWKQRDVARMLAHQLRQSSDDLTRMARTYAATGDERFRRHFERVLAIRNGAEPRPADYHLPYWDMATSPDADVLVAELTAPPGDAVPLRALLSEAGFTPAELALLARSEDESNALTALETQAFAAARAGDLPTAQALLHSDEYHRAKARIMLPIRRFTESMERRTEADIHRLSQEQRKLNGYFLGVTTLVLALVAVALVLAMVAARRHQR